VKTQNRLLKIAREFKGADRHAILCGVAALRLLVIALLLEAAPWLFKLVILSLKRVNEIWGRYGLLILRLKRFLNFGSF